MKKKASRAHTCSKEESVRLRDVRPEQRSKERIERSGEKKT